MTNESGKLNKNVKLKALRLNNLFPRVINNEKVLIFQAGEHYDFSPCVLVIQGHEDRPPKRGIVVIHQKEKFVQDFVVRVLCSFCFHLDPVASQRNTVHNRCRVRLYPHVSVLFEKACIFCLFSRKFACTLILFESFRPSTSNDVSV